MKNTSFARSLTAASVAAALTLTGCANMSETQQGTAKGAAIGAAAGAVLGAVTGGSSSAGKGAVLGAGAGALGGYIWSKKMQDQKAAMEKATAGTGVAVTQTPDNRLKMEIPNDISFDVGRSAVKADFAVVLNQFATSLNANPTTVVSIIGHTDNTGSDAVNDPLSVDRANSARDYLIARGVAITRFNSRPAVGSSSMGRGSKEPIADNSSAEGRAKNRRVEIYVAEPATSAQN